MSAPPQGPPQGGKGSPPGMPDPDAPVRYGKLAKWSWIIVKTAFGSFVLGTVLAVLAQTLAQYSFQLVSSIVSLLASDAPATAANGGGSFIDSLVPQDIRVAVLLVVVLLLVRIALDMGSRLANALCDNLMSSRLQMRLHDKLLRLGPTYHRTHDVGTTQLVVQNFALGSQAIFKDLISFPLLRGIGLVTAIVFLLGNLQKLGGAPTWMTLVLIALLLTLPLVTWWLAGRMRRAYTIVRESQKVVSEELLNSLSQPGEVQILGAEKQRSASFGQALKRLVRDRIRAVFRRETVDQLQRSSPDLLQALFLAYAGFYAVKSGDPSAAGPIVAIYMFVPEVVNPLQDLMQFYVGIQASWAQVEDVITALEEEPLVLDREHAKAAPGGLLPVTLDGVDFAYTPGGRRILDGIHHTFEPGMVTAIVARSGGGKSTIFHLLCRLYDPAGGRIAFGNDDIRDLTLRSYRGRVAKVSQFPLFIFDTIRSNFRLADADATDAEIRTVCERTGMWKVLERAAGPGHDPLDYVLPRAQDQGLSGGERRMLSITRALLTDPAVLLLDEPTTGIDAIGREMVIDLINDLGKRMSIIVVDHNVREFIAEVADEVCVLQDGGFTQIGSPDELAKQQGLYADLYHHHEEESGPGEPMQPTKGELKGGMKGEPKGGMKGTP